MGEAIGQSIHPFKAIIDELSICSKERKIERDRKKDIASTSTSTRHGRKQSRQSEMEVDCFNLDKMKESTNIIFNEMIKDIRSMKNGQEDEDSDDHDSD